MTHRVFIDGEAGTTGLQIRDRLAARDDLTLVHLDDARRKDAAARADALNGCDVAILCLPDEAALQSVDLITNDTTRVIDASTAHRVADGWTYGFPEMAPEQPAAIAAARLVSNPGCYPQGFIAITRPLIEAGLVPADFPLTYNAISGYSGGGRQMIETYHAVPDAELAGARPYEPYGLLQAHKHAPEMDYYSGAVRPPVFQPAVGPFAQGMIGAVPLALWALPDTPAHGDLHELLVAYYAETRFVRVQPMVLEQRTDEITPQRLNGTNSMHIYVAGSDAGQAVVLAVYDNLGKGASGAAVQNLNLMLGADEATGLAIAP